MLRLERLRHLGKSKRSLKEAPASDLPAGWHGGSPCVGNGSRMDGEVVQNCAARSHEFLNPRQGPNLKKYIGDKDTVCERFKVLAQNIECAILCPLFPICVCVLIVFPHHGGTLCIKQWLVHCFESSKLWPEAEAERLQQSAEGQDVCWNKSQMTAFKSSNRRPCLRAHA